MGKQKQVFLLLLISIGLFQFCKQAQTSLDGVVIETSEEKYEAKTQEVFVKSASMDKEIGANVILPKQYFEDTSMSFRVVYLLHGYGGDYNNWLMRMPEIVDATNEYNCIIVTPDGNLGSWYFDSPIDSTYQYETHIIEELIPYVDANYRTMSDVNGRTIMGLSMGGHGAFLLALRNPRTFCAAASLSGGMDLRPFPENWELPDRLGSISTHKNNWDSYSVINNIDTLENYSIDLSFECGVDDFFFEVNEDMHKALLEKGIDHEYTVRPGEHNWDYWKNGFYYQMLFLERNFKNQQKI